MQLPDKSADQAPAAKVVTQVIPDGAAKKVSRPATKRFFDFLFAESPQDLARKIGREVVVPRLKASFEEAANGFLAGMLWGGGNRPNPMVSGQVLRGGAVQYGNVSTQNAMLAARQAVVQQPSGGNYQDLVVPSQAFAETLLTNMYDLMNRYSRVTVADLYEAAGLSSAISDNSYGWTSLEGSRIRSVGNGYVLELPRPTLI